MADKIVPNLWFPGNAEEAVNFYVDIFPDSRILQIAHYPKEGLADFQKSFAGKILTIEFEISGQRFMAINAENDFPFNESVSFLIECVDQKEIDYYWSELTKDGGEESMCGWLKDKFGLRWQVNPKNVGQLVQDPKVFASMMTMKKIIIEDL